LATPSTAPLPPGGFITGYKLRMIGTPAPVFPGFEIDICDPTPEGQKPDAEWHNARVRDMLKAHPEIRTLIRPNPWTAVWCVLLAAAQVGLAVGAGWMDWWLVVSAAYVVGSWLNLNLFMLAHECNHGLVFRSTRLNRWLYTLTSLPMGQPGHHTWWIERSSTTSTTRTSGRRRISSNGAGRSSS
jgi:sphingolipid 4-desaturase/C4-monooxygenase